MGWDIDCASDSLRYYLNHQNLETSVPSSCRSIQYVGTFACTSDTFSPTRGFARLLLGPTECCKCTQEYAALSGGPGTGEKKEPPEMLAHKYYSQRTEGPCCFWSAKPAPAGLFFSPSAFAAPEPVLPGPPSA